MTLKKLIYEEINKLEEENLNEFYEVVKRFVQVKLTQPKLGALAKLKRVKIQALVDFTANLDLYINGQDV